MQKIEKREWTGGDKITNKKIHQDTLPYSWNAEDEMSHKKLPGTSCIKNQLIHSKILTPLLLLAIKILDNWQDKESISRIC